MTDAAKANVREMAPTGLGFGTHRSSPRFQGSQRIEIVPSPSPSSSRCVRITQELVSIRRVPMVQIAGQRLCSNRRLVKIALDCGGQVESIFLRYIQAVMTR